MNVHFLYYAICVFPPLHYTMQYALFCFCFPPLHYTVQYVFVVHTFWHIMLCYHWWYQTKKTNIKQACLILVLNITDICFRHLIGFFLFLFLTIYTAMQAPSVMDLSSLKRLPDMVKQADLHKIHSELLNCLPSLPNMPDFLKLKDELRTSLPSMDFLSSLSSWHFVQLLTNCLHERFSQVCQRFYSVDVMLLALFNSYWLVLKLWERREIPI